jgi:hypothetical protein
MKSGLPGLVVAILLTISCACGQAFSEISLNADGSFPYYWSLGLQPPIMVEYGAVPAGTEMYHPARPLGRLAKFGELVEGELIYTYSDTGMQGGGWLEGSIHGEAVDLIWDGGNPGGSYPEERGQVRYRLRGIYSRVAGSIKGAVEKNGKAYGSFELKSSAAPPPGISHAWRPGQLVSAYHPEFGTVQNHDLRPSEFTAQARTCSIPWNDWLSSPINLGKKKGRLYLSEQMLNLVQTQQKSGRLHESTLGALNSLANSVESGTADEKVEPVNPKLTSMYALASAELYRELARRYQEKREGSPFLLTAMKWTDALKKAGREASLPAVYEWIDSAVYSLGFYNIACELQQYFTPATVEGHSMWMPKRMPGLKQFPYKYAVGQQVVHISSERSEGRKQALILYRLNGLYYFVELRTLAGRTFPTGSTAWAFETEFRK